MPPVDQWLRAFVITVVVESTIGQRMLVPPLSRGRALGLTLLCNTCTHPALWYLLPRFDPYALWLLWAEGLVWITETALMGLAGLDLRRAAWVSLVCNGLTTALGLLGIR